MPSRKFYSSRNGRYSFRMWHFWDRYSRKLDKRYKNPYNIDYKIFYDIVKSVNYKIVDRMIYNSYVYQMPYGLGTLFVAKKRRKLHYNDDGSIDYKRTKFYMDWGKFQKLTKEERKDKDKVKQCYHYNTHTKGYHFMFYFRRKQSALPKMVYFVFRYEQPNKSKLNKAVINYYNKGKIDFHDLTDMNLTNINYGYNKPKKQSREDN